MPQRRKSATASASRPPIRIFTPPAESAQTVPQRSPIELSGEDAHLARTQALLIQHHRQLAQQLDMELQAHLQRGYGVDVTAGWRLNLAAGLIEPADVSPDAPIEPEPEPEQAG